MNERNKKRFYFIDSPGRTFGALPLSFKREGRRLLAGAG
jgi:hypothetical protein